MGPTVAPENASTLPPDMSVHSPTEAVPPTDGLTVESLPSPPPEMPTFSQEPSGKAPHHEPPRVKLVPESGTAVESGG